MQAQRNFYFSEVYVCLYRAIDASLWKENDAHIWKKLGRQEDRIQGLSILALN